MKHFYSHLIETSSLTLEIGNMDLSKEERVHLISLVESNLHHVVLDAVLSELNEEDKKAFLIHLAMDKHDEIWQLLNTKTKNIEEKIKKVANDLKKELHEDIEEIRQKTIKD